MRRLPSIPLAMSAARSPSFSLAGVPFKVPFDQIARQMGFADRMVVPKYRALHKAVAAFGRVGMSKAAIRTYSSAEWLTVVVPGKLLSYFS